MQQASSTHASLYGLQEELSRLQQQDAEVSVLQSQLKAAQQEASQSQDRTQELQSQLASMSSQHQQVGWTQYCLLYALDTHPGHSCLAPINM